MHLRDTARAQDGLVTRQQALAAGLTPSALRHRLRPNGEWQRVLPSTYATFTGALSVRQRARAAVLACGPEAALTGVSALSLYGFRYAPPLDGTVTVAMRHGRHLRLPEWVAVTTTTRLHLRLVRNLPVVPAAAAVAFVARNDRDPRMARALVSEAVQRRLSTLAELARELGEGPRRGSRVLRVALEELGAGVRSAAEADLLTAWRRSAILPEPEWNGRIARDDGSTLAVGDAVLRAVRIVVEVDSREHHFDVEAWQYTLDRHNELEAEGWVVLHLTPYALRTDPTRAIRLVEAVYLRRLDDLRPHSA